MTPDDLRDVRVAPVAQGVLDDMAEEAAANDVSGSQDFKPLVMKVLQRTLDADLNLTTDNPFVFQLMIGAYSSLSAVIQKCTTNEAREARFGAIGTEMLKVFAGARVPMGSKVKPEDQLKAMEAVQPQLQAIFDREQLTSPEVLHILKGMFRMLQGVEQIFSDSVSQSLHRMEAKILEVNDMSDITMKKLNETLMTDIDEILKKSATVKSET